MKPPDQVRRELVAQWCDRADRDLEAAGHLLTEGTRMAGIVAFHCQQAVEKYLKAFLAANQVDFPKTHDIRRLLEYVRPLHAGLAVELEPADTLTPFGVEIRYPGDAPELPPGGDAEAVALARQARDSILKILGDASA